MIKLRSSMKHYQNTNQSSAENETHAGIIISFLRLSEDQYYENFWGADHLLVNPSPFKVPTGSMALYRSNTCRSGSFLPTRSCQPTLSFWGPTGYFFFLKKVCHLNNKRWFGWQSDAAETTNISCSTTILAADLEVSMKLFPLNFPVKIWWVTVWRTHKLLEAFCWQCCISWEMFKVTIWLNCIFITECPLSKQRGKVSRVKLFTSGHPS